MALASLIRKSTLNLTNRIIQRNHRTYISAINHPNFALGKPSVAVVFPIFRHHFSTAAADEPNKGTSTESLLRVLDMEIKLAEETDDHERVETIPEGFPFKIDDNPGQQTLILTREYDGELVKVEVHMPDLVTGEDNQVGDDDIDDAEKPTRSSIPLIVSVSKKSGTSLEFHCIAYPDGIVVDTLSVKNSELSEDKIAYEGPNFHDLDEKLKKAFHKYLENRGIKPSTINFLHEYMINKDSREFLGWLKDLKQFVEA
ncbi:uncharacterized protein At2g39795, mitochondrial-like [Mercurialis annua]|uniref:uncharacterized protein At2g39795, mitochondrial-like n=1 Tax=Mercurialis annua TaxID=3986 RepID=UPI00215F473B|nr:uncharacterized protein At2g39795, mitochondrial-like [Mercurialis annua]